MAFCRKDEVNNNKKVFLNEKVAKKLFKNEKYRKILSAKVISDVIGADYNEVYDNIKLSTDEIAFSALTVGSTADAIYYDDVTYFDIELNFYNSIRKKRQLESYVYQLYLGQIHTHNDYEGLKKIVQISIDAYDRFNRNEFMYRVILMEEKEKIPYNDLLTFVHVNLAFLQGLDYTNIEICGNKLMKDLYFLICDNDDKLNKVYEGDNLMGEIIDEAKQIAGIEKMNLYLTDEEILKLDQAEYYKKGMKEGIEMTKKETVINLYHNNISIDIIAKSVNLTTSKVKAILSDIEK